jgi:predicted negative regulator of RcsB-dependent stress response
MPYGGLVCIARDVPAERFRAPAFVAHQAWRAYRARSRIARAQQYAEQDAVPPEVRRGAFSLWRTLAISSPNGCIYAVTCTRSGPIAAVILPAACIGCRPIFRFLFIMPATGAAARPAPAPLDESLTDWMQTRYRELLIVVVVAIVLIGGLMLYRSALSTQAGQAQAALAGPEQSLASGNLPLAQADLKKLISRYNGTEAAAQAALLLTATYYDQKQYVEGLAVLNQTKTSGAAKPFAAAVESMIGDGYGLQGKYAQAAAHFAEAASRSSYPTEKARYRASAARADAKAGDTAAAVAIWTALAADTKSGQSQEADLRLGELTAKPAK